MCSNPSTSSVASQKPTAQPRVHAANNFAFEFDSVLGDLERMDSIASFPSEAKSQSMVGGRSQINIHVDCRGGPHASPPSSASSIPLQFSPGAYGLGGPAGALHHLVMCGAIRST